MDDKLYKFLRLVESGSYTKAAKTLHISQPALSIAIQRLENEQGVQLLERQGRRLNLTEAGQLLYDAALEHQLLTATTAKALKQLQRRRPSVTIGMVDSIAETVCASDAFTELEADADVTIIVNNSSELRRAVEARSLDAALVIADDKNHDGVTTKIVGTEQLVLVAELSMQRSLETMIDRGVINNFISYNRGSTTANHINTQLSAGGLITHTRLYSTSPAVMLSLVLSGRGYAVLPKSLCTPLIGTTLFAHSVVLERPVALITPLGVRTPVALQTFFNQMSTQFNNIK